MSGLTEEEIDRLISGRIGHASVNLKNDCVAMLYAAVEIVHAKARLAAIIKTDEDGNGYVELVRDLEVGKQLFTLGD